MIKMEEIRNLAKQSGLTPGKLNKTELVRSIQLHEGNFDCFATAANGDCDQLACVWREDCFASASKPLVATPKKTAPQKKPTTKKTPVVAKKPTAKKTPVLAKKAAPKNKVAKKEKPRQSTTSASLH